MQPVPSRGGRGGRGRRGRGGGGRVIAGRVTKADNCHIWFASCMLVFEWSTAELTSSLHSGVPVVRAAMAGTYRRRWLLSLLCVGTVLTLATRPRSVTAPPSCLTAHMRSCACIRTIDPHHPPGSTLCPFPNCGTTSGDRSGLSRHHRPAYSTRAALTSSCAFLPTGGLVNHLRNTHGSDQVGQYQVVDWLNGRAVQGAPPPLPPPPPAGPTSRNWSVGGSSGPVSNFQARYHDHPPQPTPPQYAPPPPPVRTAQLPLPSNAPSFHRLGRPDAVDSQGHSTRTASQERAYQEYLERMRVTSQFRPA